MLRFARALRTLLPALLVSGCALTHADPKLLGITPANGPAPGGTTITVTTTPGSYTCALQPCGAPILLIGGLQVPYTTPTPTTLVAVTPPHAPGPVNVELHPGPGQIGAPSVLPAAFHYLAPAGPAPSHAAMLLMTLLLAAGGLVVRRIVR